MQITGNPMMVGWIVSPEVEYACDGRSSSIGRVEETAGGSGYLAQAVLPSAAVPAPEPVLVATVPVAPG